MPLQNAVFFVGVAVPKSNDSSRSVSGVRVHLCTCCTIGLGFRRSSQRPRRTVVVIWSILWSFELSLRILLYPDFNWHISHYTTAVWALHVCA